MIEKNKKIINEQDKKEELKIEAQEKKIIKNIF